MALQGTITHTCAWDRSGRPHPSPGQLPALLPKLWLSIASGSISRPGKNRGREGLAWKVKRCKCPCKARGQAGRSPARAGTLWSRSQLDLNFSLCIQRPSDLLLQQSVGPLQGLVLHGQLPEPQLRLLLGYALDRCTETRCYLGPRGGEPRAPWGKGPGGCPEARVNLRA